MSIIDVDEADRLVEELMYRLYGNTPPKSINDIQRTPKHKVDPSYDYEVYVKDKDDTEYRWRNTFRSSKGVPEVYIKEGREYRLVDKDKDTIFYRYVMEV